jgi:hypothetical protein
MAEITASDPDAFFSSRQATRLASKALKPMGAAGLTQAGLVWCHWLAFCTVHNVAWDAARSLDVARFCQSIVPRSSLKKTSPVTRRRYWRVLDARCAYRTQDHRFDAGLRPAGRGLG